MIFKTQYDPHDRVQCSHGSRYHISYGGHYDDDGRIVLEEVGRINVYEEIQSHAESVDIHVLMDRYRRGDVDALSRVQGFYGDITGMPTNYADALNHLEQVKQQFLSLPPEIRERFDNSFSVFLASSSDSDFLDKLGVKVEKPEPALSTELKTETAAGGAAE